MVKVSVFDVTPAKGTMSPAEDGTTTVTFSLGCMSLSTVKMSSELSRIHVARVNFEELRVVDPRHRTFVEPTTFRRFQITVSLTTSLIRGENDSVKAVGAPARAGENSIF